MDSSSRLLLRDTTERDLPFVMAAESAPECAGLVGQSTQAEHARFIADRSRQHWLVEDEGAPVGFAIVYDLNRADGGSYLKRIVVRSKGKGTGRRVIGLLAARVRDAWSSPYLWLGVYPHNTRAIRCYEACGFVPFDASAADLSRHKSLADGQALDACLLYRLTLPAQPAT